MFKLVIQDDEGKTTVVPLVRDEITIGRKEGNTIRLTERNVSRRHARILKTNDEVQIEDLGSYNGIRVNNAKIAAKASLRTTDQVQIGDYKLYLKTETAADLNATVPIDRHHIAQIDVAPAVKAAVEPAPESPPVVAAEAEPTAAAAVAPVVATPGHGRLVVVSSNLAGKEFDLTRLQMVIGRTEDNDLVVPHRSISRNHAKITRDPESLHYTISDLQSANGVRVNDQDYAKVELRRGDLVDLGHVRLRFVDPGEDFVFARDAVITDVPEEGGRKGLVVAVVLAMMVLGAAAAVLWFKSHDDPAMAIATQQADSTAAIPPDSAGSAAAVQPIAEDAAVAVVDASSAAVVDPAQEAARITTECAGYEKEAKWSDLTLCADKLVAVDAAAADKFKAKVSLEIRANIQKDKMDTELAAGNLVKAKAHLSDIPGESVAKKPAQAAFDLAERRLVDDFKARAARAKRAGKCADIDVLANQANAQSSRAAAEVRAFKCESPPPLDCTITLKDANDKKCVKQFCGSHETDPRCGAAPPPCDADAILKTAEGSVALGLHKEALGYYEDALRCKFDGHTLELAYMSACNAKIPAKARQYWKKLSAERQNSVVQICTRNQITRDVLDAP